MRLEKANPHGDTARRGSQDESPSGDTTGPFNEPGAHSPPQDLDYELVRRIGSNT